MKTTTITPPAGLGWADLRDAWEHRELLYFLAWRDVKVRYKQAVLGVAWAVLQPFGMMLILTVVFHRMAGIDASGVPYPLFSMAALTPWLLFSQGVNLACASLVANHPLVTKVYLPRILLPISCVLSPLVDFASSIAVLAALMAYFKVSPSAPGLALAPLCVLLCILASLGVGLWTATAYAYFRDIRYLVTFGLSMLIYVSPVIYPTDRVPIRWRWLYELNPLVGVIDGFRWSLLGVGPPPGFALAVSAGVTLALLLSGLIVFYRFEPALAEKV